MNVISSPVPSPTNPLGVKGAGEAGTVGALPVIINAVVDALRAARRDASRHAGQPGAGVGRDPQGARRQRGRERTGDALLKPASPPGEAESAEPTR